MAHSNSTQYYNLPQFDSTDKPAWLVDVNPAYYAIDAGIHAAKAAADDAQSDATQALSDASSAVTTASGADAKASGSIASLADTFDPTATYNVGDLVIYNNLLYICIVDVTVPGAWTGSGNWNRTTIETEIDKKQNTIDRLTSVSELMGTDEIAVYDGINTKKTTAADVAALGTTQNNIQAVKGSYTGIKGVYGGYISASRNYFDFFIPCNTNGLTSISNVSFTSITILTADGRSDNPFSAYTIDVTPMGLFVDCRYTSTQANSISGVVSFDGLTFTGS